MTGRATDMLEIHVGPVSSPLVAGAITTAGARIADLERADGVVWLDPRPETLPPLPSSVRWVQLPGAGVERWLARIAAEPDVDFTSAAGVYARPVAEHAMTLLLAGVRRIPEAARADRWRRAPVPTLEGARVAVVGAGGIGRELIALLRAHHAEVLAVTRRGHPVGGVAQTFSADRIDSVWPAADHVVLTAPATHETYRLIGARQLQAMSPTAVLVNVARGTLVNTDDLVAALRSGAIGGAALDVTDPEPLPKGHPLWTHPRALITPHVATAPAHLSPHFAARVGENIVRLGAGEQPLSVVDPGSGY